MESPETTYFSLKKEVSSAYLSDLLAFIYQSYIVPLNRNFTNVRRWVDDGKETLAFTFVDPRGLGYVDIEVAMGDPVEVKMTPSNRDFPQAILNRLKEDLIITVQMFEEKIRNNTLYFAWVPQKGTIPEQNLTRKKKILKQIFMGNMILLFVISIIISYALFLIVTEAFGLPQDIFPIILLASQFVIVLFSDKIIGGMGDWPITPESPYVHILQYHIPQEQFEEFRQRYTKGTLLQVKSEIDSRTLAVGRPIDAQTVQEVFAKYGISIKPENVSTKTVNVYQIVKEAATSFNMPVPKIVISNVIVPNAAATGPTPRFGLVLITTGLLVQLDDDEVFSVIGHEISHVKSRDPLALSALFSIEYILRVYYLWQFLFFFGLFSIYIYILFSFAVLFFIAKFFEARADLEAAIKLGQPKILARALTKIGYRRIQFERMPSSMVGRWLGMDPHPPISFRIERLENLSEPWKIKHPFIQSTKDCINGLFKEIRHM
jgi:heat shock protein HtpX